VNEIKILCNYDALEQQSGAVTLCVTPLNHYIKSTHAMIVGHTVYHYSCKYLIYLLILNQSNQYRYAKSVKINVVIVVYAKLSVKKIANVGLYRLA